MYRAIVEKDTFFEGIFFTAVKTTGIFCRPSCSARKPKMENVEFFKTTKECILRGYRPCKVCRPLENLHQTPLEIQQIINELSQNPSLKFKDFDLKKKRCRTQLYQALVSKKSRYYFPRLPANVSYQLGI